MAFPTIDLGQLVRYADFDIVQGRLDSAQEKIEHVLAEGRRDVLCQALVAKVYLCLARGQFQVALNLARYLDLTWNETTITNARSVLLSPGIVKLPEQLSSLDGLSWRQMTDEALPTVARAHSLQTDELAGKRTPPPGRRPLVVLEINGGLGSQMFQYAAALQWARRCGAELKVERSFYEKVVTRDDRRYWLSHFKLELPEATAEDMERVAHLRHTQDLGRFDAAVLEGEGDALLYGYWPSHRYFESVASEIPKDFELRNEGITAYARGYVERLRESASSVVAMHVRRGDNTWPGNRNQYRLHHLEYYREAARRFPRGTRFLVFSDRDVDRKWCRANLRLDDGYTIEISEAHSFLFDFALMAACDHLIISVSAYSWWAAWLNPSLGKRVITPHAVHGTGVLGATIRQDERSPDGWETLRMPPELILD